MATSTWRPAGPRGLRPHDVFGLEFGRIAEVLDVSVPSARQLASRARRRVAKAKQSTPRASKAERERVLMVFRAAHEAGDLAGLVRIRHSDRIDFAEGGGELALVFHQEGRVFSVDTVQITDGLIIAYRRVVNPDKRVRL